MVPAYVHAYPPLSANALYGLTDWGSTLWLSAVALEFVAFLLSGINFVTTLMNSRAPTFGIPHALIDTERVFNASNDSIRSRPNS